MPFPFHSNQISTLPPQHIFVKTIFQVTIPTRTLAIIPTTLTSYPKNNCNYNLTGTQPTLGQNLFIVPLLKIFSTKLPTNLLCNIINISPDNIILPRNIHIGKLISLDHSGIFVHTVYINDITHVVDPSITHANCMPPKNKNQHLRKTSESQKPLVSSLILPSEKQVHRQVPLKDANILNTMKLALQTMLLHFFSIISKYQKVCLHGQVHVTCLELSIHFMKHVYTFTVVTILAIS